MTEQVQKLLDFYRKREYRNARTAAPAFDAEGLSFSQREVQYLKTMLEAQVPVFFENDIFGFYRSTPKIPTGKESPPREHPGYAHLMYSPGNVTPDYTIAISRGLDDLLKEIKNQKLASSSNTKQEYYSILEEELELILAFSERYRAAAKDKKPKLARALETVPRKPATTFYESLVFLKILIFALRCCPDYCHLTLGRFDQVFFPYVQHDMENGMTEDEILETLELFFLSLNFDTDLYFGVQQGDDGQSLVLGGYDEDGNDTYNLLSELCMIASRELQVIDPKINLRVSKKTPLERLKFATELTKVGLGFPQYLNDDVIVPGLLKLGYEKQDAVNYSVAACWEILIPGKDSGRVNVASFNFPRIIRETTFAELKKCETFSDFLSAVEKAIEKDCLRLQEKFSIATMFPCPLLTLFMDGGLESGTDRPEYFCKYPNKGFHGVGLANAADALTAVKKYIYDEKSITKQELLRAMEENFEGHDALRQKLVHAPKVGNNLEEPDELLCKLISFYAKHMSGKPNGHGGICRAGTGSAMNYISSALKCGATADGRRDGEPYPSSYSPALGKPTSGPLSVIQSFTKPDLTGVINGGPLTMEVSDSVFRNPEGVEKVALLVQAFIALGGHQLQLNALNPEILKDAQEHPENHRDLIVRVWGWSGYFTELEKKYQDHIIARTAFHA